MSLHVACQAILLNQVGRAGFAIISITSVHARIGPKQPGTPIR